jgi:hypothetical protein
MDARRAAALEEEARAWSEAFRARREAMEELILRAEMAVSLARAVVTRASWASMAIQEGGAGARKGASG